MTGYAMQYQSTQVLTASPERILIMLYDGAIHFLRQASQALVEGRKVAKAEKISKAMAIISELSNTLDFETGGEIADQLDALYSFMIRELSQANLKDDATKITIVETLMSELRETWLQAIHIKANATVQEAVVSPAHSCPSHRPLHTSAL